MKKNLKSIGAVVAGVVTISILSGVVSAILTKAGVFPDGKLPLHGSLLVIISMLAYQAVIYLAGCLVTAKLAPSNPVKHVLILGGLGAALNLLSGVGLAMKEDAAFFWFYLGLATLSLLAAWFCVKLYTAQASKK
jgi:hypothetical protein